MKGYIDGFVLPVPADKIEQYREIAAKAGSLWREHGALEYIEGVADDMDAKEMIAFPTLAGAKPGEVVMFSYIAYASRAHRDEVNAKVMADPRIKEMGCGDAMPFDCGRMAFGGFRILVSG